MGADGQALVELMPLFGKKGRRGDDAPVDPNERAPETGLKYKDLAVLGEMIKAGADLAQPRHVAYYLYFGDRATAEAAAEEAGARSFDCAVADPMPQYPDQWSLLCEQHAAVLSIEAVRGNGDFFDDLALRHGGEFDGWEASAT